MTEQGWVRDLAAIVGEANLLPDGEREGYCVDGKLPQAVVFPTEVEQVQEVMRWAQKNGVRVIPIGNGSKLGFGNPPPRVEVLLSTLHLRRVVEYEPENLTAIVQSGLSLKAFQTHLETSGQFLPLDPAYQDFGTVGGTFAANLSGPMRLKYGAPRDLLIGIQVVLPDGTLIKGGGKVVKNVAGYDVPKLYVGSYGTLGVIVELTLRLQPLPPAFQLVLARFPTVAQAVRMGHEIAGSQLVPTLVTAASALPAASISQPCLVLGADGHPETVAWQIKAFQERCHQGGAIQVDGYDQNAARALHRALFTFPEVRWRDPAIVCRFSVPTTSLEFILEQAQQRGQALHFQVTSLAHVGHGIGYVVIHGDDEELEGPSGVSIIKQLRADVRSQGGFLVVEMAPLPVKREVDVWGAVGNSLPMMRKIKDALDPNGILNPGRFVGGL